MVPWSAAWLWARWQRRREEALPHGRRRAPFLGLTPSEPRGQIAGISKFPAWRAEKLTGAHDPRHALQRNGSLADQWYRDDGDIRCHPILVLPFLQDFDVANARVEAERKPLKTEVIYDVDNLDAAHPE